MGYKRMTLEDLYSIFKRWHDGQKISGIAIQESKDRKTVTAYIQRFQEKGWKPGCKLPEKDELNGVLKSFIPVNSRKAEKQEFLLPHLDEIQQLLSGDQESLDIYHTWLVICAKYSYSGSYETFKLFVHKNQLTVKKQTQTIRFDTIPGEEIQIDYGKAGTLTDQDSGRKRTVYAFCGVLSHSRLPFIRFEYRQDCESFVEANIRMLEYYEGAPGFITLDNLKAGVIKADLYDPKLNHAYQEMADHYELFINPCRVASPKDKAKVERFIRPARQLFRTLKNIHPNATLSQLNQLALKWCLNEYGMKEHGTTGIPPALAFRETEKKTLKALPDVRFEVPCWKNPKVGRDQFIQFEGKYYSLPAQYIGKNVRVKRLNAMISIYSDYQLIRRYIIPVKTRAWYDEDFPEVKREMMNHGYPAYLLAEALKLGENARKLVEAILSPHAHLNLRRAQGILAVLKEFHDASCFDEVCLEAISRKTVIPKELKRMFRDAVMQLELPLFDQTSPLGQAMTRSIDYFWNHHPCEDEKIH